MIHSSSSSLAYFNIDDSEDNEEEISFHNHRLLDEKNKNIDVNESKTSDTYRYQMGKVNFIFFFIFHSILEKQSKPEK